MAEPYARGIILYSIRVLHNLTVIFLGFVSYWIYQLLGFISYWVLSAIGIYQLLGFINYYLERGR